MSRNSHLFRVLAVATAVIACGVTRAQELEMSVSPTPVGSGARAAGMADAFVAVADDATAASWNPAGLVQLERPEMSLVGSFNAIQEKFRLKLHDEGNSSPSDDNYDLNYFSLAYPIPVLVAGRNVCVSLNYQRKYDFSRKFTLKYNTRTTSSSGMFNNLLSMDFEQEGGLSTLTPAFAMELTQRLSVGLALNLWRSSFLSDNGWEQEIRTHITTFFGSNVYTTSITSHEQYSDFTGENITGGVLWNVTDRWNCGLRCDTAFTGEAGYRKESRTTRISSLGSPSVVPSNKQETRHVRFPTSVAAGVSYRANDRLTLSLDITRTDWNDFYVKDASGVRRSLVDYSQLDDSATSPHFEPTYTVRLGTEYVFIPKRLEETLNSLWTLRGGLFYDPEPATGKSDTNVKGTGKPDPFYGFALGVGWLAYQRVNIDLAYQLRYGKGVNSDFLRGTQGFEEDVVQHRVLLSTVIYF